MAKGNLLLGMGRGSIGDITMYRAYGSQVSRARVKVIKNPRTEAQNIQRIIMATTVYGYSAMKSICDHSFQGKSYGAECMNRFNSLNASMLRGKLANEGLEKQPYPDPATGAYSAMFNDKQGINPKGVAPNNWVISEGTIAPIAYTPAVGYTSEACYGVSLGELTLGSDPGSYSKVCELLNLQIGDQLTICAIDFQGTFHYGRFILSSNDGNQTQEIEDSDYWNARNINVTPTFGNDLILELDDMKTREVGACAVGLIISRRDGQGWKRSNCTMQVLNVDLAGVGVDMSDALWQLTTGDIDVTSPYYLNNANQATTEGGSEEENP